jgi:preprotein translocase subunit SecG
MQTVLIVAHIIIALFLITVILFQRTSSDGLQGLGSSAGAGGVMSPAASANFMTRLTAILATVFIINCLVLANLATSHSKTSILDKVTTEQKVDKKEIQKKLPIAE